MSDYKGYYKVLIVGFAGAGKTQIIQALVARDEVAIRTQRGETHVVALDAAAFKANVAFIDTAGEDYGHMLPNDGELQQFIALLNTNKPEMSGLVLVVDLTMDIAPQIQVAKNLFIVLRSLYAKLSAADVESKVNSTDPLYVKNELARLKRIPIPILVLFSKADDRALQNFVQQPPFFVADANIRTMREMIAQNARFFHIDFCHSIRTDYDTGVVVAFGGGVVPVMKWWLKNQLQYSKCWWCFWYLPTHYWIALQKFLDKYVIFERRNRW